MSVALRGNLQDFGIAEVFQLISQQRKTGTLDISHGAQSLRLAFDAGRVVWGQRSRFPSVIAPRLWMSKGSQSIISC